MAKKNNKRGKLSRDLLIQIAKSAGISLVIFLILRSIASIIAQEYCFNNDIYMTEFDWIELDQTIFFGSAGISCVCFCVLFISMISRYITYILTITGGIENLKKGEYEQGVPVEQNNELTDLAVAINDMSQAQKEFRKKENALTQEKEQLIRTLSHDIRTPLTSILAYSDYLLEKGEISPGEQRSYAGLIQKKAQQIRDLTDILLDGTHRNLEKYENAKFLFQQLCMEFQEELENEYEVVLDFSGCPDFSGVFDIRELQRIFDNLSSNIKKYADPQKQVTISVGIEGDSLCIYQSNAILQPKPQSESYQIGLKSMRRIAQLYGGKVEIKKTETDFAITISFIEYL